MSWPSQIIRNKKAALCELLWILIDTPQEFTVRPIFIFYIFPFYLSLSFANNTSPRSDGRKFDEVIKKLELDMVDICDWLQLNWFEANPGNFFDFNSSIWNRKLWKAHSRKRSSNSEVLFGLPNDSNVTFNQVLLHVR